MQLKQHFPKTLSVGPSLPSKTTITPNLRNAMYSQPRYRTATTHAMHAAAWKG